MIEQILNYLTHLPKEIIVIIIAMLPIAELRGAIPVALTMFKFGITKSFLLALTGNFLFVLPFLWFLNHLHKYMMSIKWYNKFFSWWFNRVKSKTQNIEKYEYIGLSIFVAIPLPMTGAWSGCVASYLLGLNLWKSTIAIFVGIIIAGIIVTISTLSVAEGIKLVF